MANTSSMLKYVNIFRFYQPRGYVYAIKMVFRVFKEIDLFDLSRRLNTRTIKKSEMQSKDYMWYSPVYSSVCKEMISIATQFYDSAVKYSNYGDTKVFIDLGGGLGKPSIITCEQGTFSRIISVDLDKELFEEASKNFHKYQKYRAIESVLSNVESDRDMYKLFRQIFKDYNHNYTLFVFNKNSYNSKVLRKSLKLIHKYGPKNVIYLYQNPVHSNVLLSLKYRLVATDDKSSNAQKNYKYHLYFRSL